MKVSKSPTTVTVVKLLFLLLSLLCCHSKCGESRLPVFGVLMKPQTSSGPNPPTVAPSKVLSAYAKYINQSTSKAVLIPYNVKGWRKEGMLESL